MILTLFAFQVATAPSNAQMQCICHSKQPAMKRMHEMTGKTGCGNCHTKDENLMSKREGKDPAAKANTERRQKEDRLCVPCHSKKEGIAKEAGLNKDAMGISGTLYCPKDKLKLPPDSKRCPKCSGPLLNMDALMATSAQSPSNDICMNCHLSEEIQQIKRHTIFNNEKLKKCLDCHTGHSDCGNCHH